MSIDHRNSTRNASFGVRHGAVSDLGMRRANNQDAVAVNLVDEDEWRNRGHFFMVADGMGAHAAGELASQLAADNIPHTYRKLRGLKPHVALRQAIHQANNLIHGKGESAIEFNGMGTTCSCLVLLPAAALIAHVGDSRVYRLRGGQLEQLTFDHSLVWEMAAASQTSADDLPACIPKNVITRSLGPHPQVNVDIEGPYEVWPGDKFLLCSDGLTAVVDNSLIGSLADSLPPQEAADTLVDVANLRGGPDNISLIIIEVAGRETPTPECNGQAPALPAGPAQAPSVWQRLWGWIFADRANAAARAELGGPFGGGPYRHYNCAAAAAASDMNFLCREIMALESAPESSMGSRRDVDWAAFRQGCQEAEAAIADGQHEAAITHFARAIRTLMAQVRREHREQAKEETRPGNDIF